jgi:hypothetical protein
MLAVKLGARQAQQAAKIAGQQFLRGRAIAFLDPPDQLGNRPGRGHLKNRSPGEIASLITEPDCREPASPLQEKRRPKERFMWARRSAAEKRIPDASRPNVPEHSEEVVVGIHRVIFPSWAPACRAAIRSRTMPISYRGKKTRLGSTLGAYSTTASAERTRQLRQSNERGEVVAILLS